MAIIGPNERCKKSGDRSPDQRVELDSRYKVTKQGEPLGRQ